MQGDDEILGFGDASLVGPAHFTMIPKRRMARLGDVLADDRDVLGNTMELAGRFARGQGSTEGFRTVVKTGRVERQGIYHLRVHIIGGKGPLPGMIQKSK